MSWREQHAKEAKEAYQAVSSVANNMSHDSEAFVEAFLRDHNTLQQQVGSMFLKALVALADQSDEFPGDLRNEAIIRKARIVRAALAEAGEILDVPLI